MTEPEPKKFNKQGLANFLIPLSETETTLRQAYDRLMDVGNPPTDVPLIIRICENPKYHYGGFGFFKGRISLEQHDYAHIILGRGLTLMDEAFVIGFTMGSSDKVTTTEERLFAFLASRVYPKPYRFSADGTRVFRDAVHLGYVSACEPVEQIDFTPLLDLPLAETRRRIGLEPDLLQAYYEVEARRFPHSSASQRLVTPDSATAQNPPAPPPRPTSTG